MHYHEKICRDCGRKMSPLAGRLCIDCLHDRAEERADRYLHQRAKQRRRQVDALAN